MLIATRCQNIIVGKTFSQCGVSSLRTTAINSWLNAIVICSFSLCAGRTKIKASSNSSISSRLGYLNKLLSIIALISCLSENYRQEQGIKQDKQDKSKHQLYFEKAKFSMTI